MANILARTPVPIDTESSVHAVPLTGVNSGELIIIAAASNDARSFDSVPGFQILKNEPIRSDAWGGVFTRIADGTETTLNVTLSGNTKTQYVVIRIGNWGGALSSIVISDQASSISTTLDPLNVATTWDTPDTLFIQVLLARRGNGSNDISGFSAGYANGQNFVTTSGSGGATVGLADRTATVISTDPGEDAAVATIASATSWAGYTIGIRDVNTDFGLTGLSASGPFQQGDTFTANFANGDGTETFDLGGLALTADSQDASSATFTIPDLRAFGTRTLQYGTDLTFTATKGADSDSVTFQIEPETGFVVGAVAAKTGYLAAGAFSGVDVGDQFYAPDLANSDHSVGLIAGTNSQQNLSIWYRDLTDGVWSSTPFTLTVEAISNDPDNAATGSVAITGTPETGQTLTADTSGLADADGISGFAYEWKRGGTPIAGANASTYTPVGADVGPSITVEVVLTDNDSNSYLFISPGVTISNADSVAAGTVSIDGTLSEGSVLTANTSLLTDGDGIASFTYQWLRDGSGIAGATSSTYTTVSADVGPDISVRVTLEDNNANTYDFTSSTVTISAGVIDTTPDAIDLGADVVDSELGQVVQRQFTIAGVDAGQDITITATGSASVSAGTGRLGDTITVSLTSSNTFGASVSGGADANGVADSFSITTRNAVVPAISAQPSAASVIDGNQASFSVTATNAASYQWRRNGVNIAGATSATYSFTAALSNNNDSFDVIITSSDAQSVTSNAAVLTVSAAANDPVITIDYVPRFLETDVQAVTLFVGRGNHIQVGLSYEGNAVNLESFTRFELLGLTTNPLDSATNANVFDISEGGGVMTIDGGAITPADLLRASGSLKTTLIGYTASEPEGVILWHPSLAQSSVTVTLINTTN